MSSLTYKMLNLHFSNQYETSTSYLILNTSNSHLFFSTLTPKCEFIHNTPHQAEALSSIRLYHRLHFSTRHVSYPPPRGKDFRYKEVGPSLELNIFYTTVISSNWRFNMNVGDNRSFILTNVS